MKSKVVHYDLGPKHEMSNIVCGCNGDYNNKLRRIKCDSTFLCKHCDGHRMTQDRTKVTCKRCKKT
jgi:hypothetical protein